MTAFLEQLVGEPVEAHDRRHELIPATTPNSLRVGQGHSLTDRSVLLRGSLSVRPYVYARSLLDASRLPAGVLRRLESTHDPIGRVLVEEGVLFTRVSLDPTDEPHVSLLARTATAPRDFLLAREYRLDVAGIPVMVIAEWFLPALAAFLTPS